MAESEIEHLDSIIQRGKPIQENELLYQAGDSFNCIYALRSGCLKSYTIAPDGTEQITGFHLPGELVGLDALCDNRHNSYAEALQTSMVCAMPYEHLQSLADQIPTLQAQLVRVMSRGLREDQELMLLLGKKSSEERFAAFIINLASRYHRRGFASKQFRLPMQRRDISNYLGLALETVSRLIAKLQKNGLVSVQNREVEILDPKELSRLAGTDCKWTD